MQPSAIITGVGLASALGASLEQSWQALVECRCIRAHTRVIPTETAGSSRVANLAIQSAREAMVDAGWDPGAFSAAEVDDTAIVVGTSKGPIASWCDAHFSSSDDSRAAAGGANLGLAAVADELVEHLGLHGCRRLTVSAACASGLVALARAAMMLQMGEIRRVLVVAAEASVHPLFVGSFQRLGVLAAEGELCRPFDRNRRGFLMSEAAAAMCLQRLDDTLHRDRRRAAVRVAVDGIFLAADATHLVAGDATGRTLERAVVQLTRHRPADLLHAHGTGTVRADEIESAAIDRALATHSAAHLPIVYSHKGALGHSLGAAGLVAAAINHQCHVRGCVPANVNTISPLRTRRTTIPSASLQRPIRRSIACAAGFGGPVAAVGLATV